MQSLRNAKLLARCVLVWFALTLGAAIASPLVKPQAMLLICSASGVMQLVVQGDDGNVPAGGGMPDCPLCVTTGAPPPMPRLVAEPQQVLPHALRAIPAVHIAARTAAPLPARGPPAFS